MDFAIDLLATILRDAFTSIENMINSSSDLLTGKDSNFNFMDAWDTVIKFSDKLEGFCLTIMAICLLVELINVSIKVDMLKWEHALRTGIKFCLAKVMVDTAPTFLKACYLQSAKWITDIAGTSVGTLPGYQAGLAVSNLLDGADKGFWKVIFMFLTLVIPIFVIKIASLLIMIMAFARFFELLALLAVSPLPCAFFPLSEGGNGGFSRITKKYFLNFIAVCLQGVMMLVCLKVYSIIMSNYLCNTCGFNIDDWSYTGDTPTNTDEIIQTVQNLCYTIFLSLIVLVLSITKCSQWAKQILDAA